jgi:branched-subunit amino acid ABC-type transport system permease component
VESNYKLMVIFITLILILIFKPSGILKGKS